MKEEVKAVLFDFDGVIADSFDILWELHKDAAEKCGITWMKKKQDFKDMYLDNYYKSLEKKEKSAAKRKCLVRITRKEVDVREIGTPLFPGARPALRRLASNCKLVIISSNYNRIIRHYLKKNNMSSLFEFVVGADKIRSKERKIRYALKRLGVRKEQAAYVGDTLGDMKEAHKVGVKAVGAPWGVHNKKMLAKGKPDLMLSRPSEIANIAVRLG